MPRDRADPTPNPGRLQGNRFGHFVAPGRAPAPCLAHAGCGQARGSACMSANGWPERCGTDQGRLRSAEPRLPQAATVQPQPRARLVGQLEGAQFDAAAPGRVSVPAAAPEVAGVGCPASRPSPVPGAAALPRFVVRTLTAVVRLRMAAPRSVAVPRQWSLPGLVGPDPPPAGGMAGKAL